MCYKSTTLHIDLHFTCSALWIIEGSAQLLTFTFNHWCTAPHHHMTFNKDQHKIQRCETLITKPAEMDKSGNSVELNKFNKSGLVVELDD